MNDNSEQFLLELRGVCVEFAHRRGNLRALNQVSFTLKAGEVLGVVGESGAGKSLTGAAIIGLLDPPGRLTAGEIWFRGQRIDQLTPAEQRKIRGRAIGAIFQDPLTALNPLYTVGQQLVETMRTHLPLSALEAREKAIVWLDAVGISAPEKRFAQYPHEFSGGMRQRVVIALALCAEPQLLIADEPTTALDVSVQAQIIELIQSLCRKKQTAVLLITHDMGVIAEATDRVAVMYAGRLIEIGETRAMIQGPAHPYTQGLMGAIPRLSDQRERLTQIEGTMPRLDAIPAGCAFHPRCPKAIEPCAFQRPELTPLHHGQVACWLYGTE